MAEVDLSDPREVLKFIRFLRQRLERPEEPMFVTYADHFGDVVFEGTDDNR